MQHKNVLSGEAAEAEGSIILTEPLDFKENGEIEAEEIELLEEEPLIDLESFLIKTKELMQLQEPEQSQEPAWSI